MSVSTGTEPDPRGAPVRQGVATAAVSDIRRTPRRRRSSRPVWDEAPSIPAQGAKGVVLVMICLAVLVPLYTIILTSLSPQAAITRAGGLVLVPDGLTLDAYRQVLSGGIVTRAVLVSLGVTGVGTAISLVVSVLAA